MQPSPSLPPVAEPRPTTATRWFGTGHSRAQDPYLRGRQATQEASGGREACLVLVLTDAVTDLPTLLDGVRRAVVGNPSIVGCTTNGELDASGPLHGGATVIALGGPGFDVRTAVARELSVDQREAGRQAAACVDGLDQPHRTVILLSDGLAAQHDLVRGVYSVTGARVPLVGGCAGDDMAFRRTYQFVGDAAGVEVLSDAVVAVGLGSSEPIGIGIAHGWDKTGDPMTITSASGGQIYELDGERAFDVFLRRCDDPPADLEDKRSLGYWSHQHPFGMSRRSGEDIRTLHDMDPVEGSLSCLADVQQGALAWLMETDQERLIDCAADSSRQAIAAGPAGPPLGVLVFDCCARMTRLGPAGVEAEVRGLAQALDGVPFAGFYTYGEIARVHGARGMHQMTVVSLALW
jgi:hypothetical protein